MEHEKCMDEKPSSDNLDGPVKEDIVKYKKEYTAYSDTQKYRVILCILDKLVSAREAGKRNGVHPRTAQRWWKAYSEAPDTFFDPKRSGAVKKELNQVHKDHVIKLIDDNPSTVIDEVLDSLTREFDGLNLSKATGHRFMKDDCQLTFKKAQLHALKRNDIETINKRYDWAMQWVNTDIDFLANCVFIDESGFHINMKRNNTWSIKGTTPTVKVPLTRAKTHTILGRGFSLWHHQHKLATTQ